MIGLLARLMRTALRQDAERAHAAGSGVALMWPAPGAPITHLPSRSAEPVARAGQTSERVRSRPLAAQIETARRLNPPLARVPRRKPAPAPKAKPRPLPTDPALKRRPAAESGVILARLGAVRAPTKAAKAEIIDLVAVRRARQVEATDREIAALFG